MTIERYTVERRTLIIWREAHRCNSQEEALAWAENDRKKALEDDWQPQYRICCYLSEE